MPIITMITMMIIFVDCFIAMIKNFLFPKLKCSSSRYFYRFFGSFYRRGGAAISEFCGGLSSPPQAAKTVRTISNIDHILEKRKELEVVLASVLGVRSICM